MTRLAADIADFTALGLSLCDICLAVAVFGGVFALIEALLVLGFTAEEGEGAAPQPAVTVLKPLHGAEPDLANRLTAFCRQDYHGDVQVLCGTQNWAAPALADLRPASAVVREPAIELTTDPRSHGINKKVSNLINMMPRARHDVLVLSDSDIVVGRGYLRAVTRLLALPRVGAVTCLYYGIGSDDVWARLSALAINSHFLPQAVAAVTLGLAKPCSGATIALRRSTLDRIGGFGALADVLADDYAIGFAVRDAGYDVVTAPFVVGHRCFESTMRQLLLHQIRVARTIKSIDPIGYAGTIVTHPLPLSLIAMLSGSASAALVAIAVLLARVTLCRCVERRFGLPRQDYWLIPVQDVVAFGVYVASFFGATVHWRGTEYRVTADGTLVEDQHLSGS